MNIDLVYMLLRQNVTFAENNFDQYSMLYSTASQKMKLVIFVLSFFLRLPDAVRVGLNIVN